MKIPKGKKDQIRAGRKAAKPNLEVEIRDDGSVIYYENPTHKTKLEDRKAAKKAAIESKKANKVKRVKKAKKA